MSSGSAGGSIIADAVGNIIMVIGIILIVMLIIGVWLFTKAVNAIIRAFVKNPKSKALWIALAVFFLCIGLLVSLSLTQTDQTYSAIAEGAVGLSFVSLVITARCVELSASMTFERERGGLVQEVLHRPWWQMDDKPEEQEAALAA
jgi:uncharacterized iron-regulated membrane protein